jgi:hypothetical protein
MKVTDQERELRRQLTDGFWDDFAEAVKKRFREYSLLKQEVFADGFQAMLGAIERAKQIEHDGATLTKAGAADLLGLNPPDTKDEGGEK